MLDGIVQDFLKRNHHLFRRVLWQCHLELLEEGGQPISIQQVTAHPNRDPTAIGGKHLNAGGGIVRLNCTDRVPCNFLLVKRRTLAEKDSLTQCRYEVLW